MIDRLEARLSAAVALAEEGEGRREQASAAKVMTLTPVNVTAAPGGILAGGAASPLATGNTERAAQPGDAEEAAVATGDEAEAAANGVAALPANPEDTNVWPTAAEEAAFLSDARVRGEPVVPVARAVAEDAEDADEKKKPLPKLDELVNRIPAETRELLDELFRAKFVAVRRVKKSDLKA